MNTNTNANDTNANDERGLSIHQILSARRARLGLTQQALSNLTGVHVTRISTYETGAFTPSIETLQRLAIALGPFVIFPVERPDVD